eukprot:COSAG01_NODE_25880_length_730_cov_1.057052_2_plen_140_part_00
MGWQSKMRARAARAQQKALLHGRGADDEVSPVKVLVVAPRLEVSFAEGVGGVAAMPTLPRPQLQAMLEQDLLPRFTRIFSRVTASEEGELEALDCADPLTQSQWVLDHLEVLREQVGDDEGGHLFHAPVSQPAYGCGWR